MSATPPRFGVSNSCPIVVLPLGATTTSTIRRQRRILLPSSPDDKFMQIPTIEILGRGNGLTPGPPGSPVQGQDPILMVRLSKNGGKTWLPERQIHAGLMGDYLARWRLLRATGNYRNAVLEVSISDPCDWQLLAAMGNADRRQFVVMDAHCELAALLGSLDGLADPLSREHAEAFLARYVAVLAQLPRCLAGFHPAGPHRLCYRRTANSSRLAPSQMASRRMAAGCCRANAADLVSRVADLRYVEDVAMDVGPTWHAWAIDGDDQMWDRGSDAGESERRRTARSADQRSRRTRGVVMVTTPVLTASDDSPWVDRIADKVRTLAAVKPTLVRLLEWQIDSALAKSQRRLADEREHGCGSDEEEAYT